MESLTQWAKSPKKQSVGVYNMALYFECRINKMHSFILLFGDFAHWESKVLLYSVLKLLRPQGKFSSSRYFVIHFSLYNRWSERE